MLKFYKIMQRCKSHAPSGIRLAMLMFLVFALGGQVMSQDSRTVQGVVREDGLPLPGASVKIKGNTTAGVVTDAGGRFTIQAKPTDILTISFIGMETQEVLVANKASIDIALKASTSTLDDVVVIGYQTVKKPDLTGAVGQVKVSDIIKAPVAGFAEALAGRVAGVRVQSTDGQPGNTMSIQIRGASSINNSVQPLYVIDGFATEATESINLNPDDIESITILKDAASTAVYGSRGTNGVVVITTKSGKVGKPVVSLGSSYGTQSIIKQIDLMDPYEFVKYQYERNAANATTSYLSNGRTLESYKSIEGVYWPDEISQTGSIFRNNIAIRGGTEQTKYAISGAGFDQKGVLINTGYKRYQGRVKVDQIISKKIKAGLTAEYMDVSAFGMQASATPVSSVSSALWFRAWAYRPVNGSNSTIDILDADADPTLITTSDIRLNPRTNALNEYLYNKYTNFNTNVYLNYEITKKLVLKVQGIKNILKPSQERFYNARTFLGSPSNPNRPNGVYGSIYNNEVNIWSNENTLTYTNTFNKAHNLTLLAGSSQTSAKGRAFGYTSTFLPEESTSMADLNYGITTGAISTSTSNTLRSFFGIMDYNYKSKYYLKGSLRADGTSKFAKAWGYFPTGAVAWNMHNEDFMKEINAISTSKLRASFGITGNNRIADFEWQAQLESSAAAGYPFNNGSSNGTAQTSIENRSLTWERTIAKDIGYELGLFKNRIEFTFDAYDRVTKDLLISDAPLAAHTGQPSATKNVGSLRNRGLEFSLNTVNIRKKNFSWESSFNISFNKNKIVALAQNQRRIITSPSFEVSFTELYLSAVGQPIGQMYGYVWDGNYQYSDFDNPAPGVYILKSSVPSNGAAAIQPGDIKYKDLNGDGTVNTLDRTIIGRGQPIHYGGFMNDFKYKGFGVSAFLQWSYGNDIYNANRIILEGNSNGRTDMNQFASYVDRWSPENQDAPNYRAGGGGQVGYHSSRVVEDGSYLRLKTVTLDYTVPVKYIKKAYLSSLTFNVSAQNLVTFTKYSGMDPEVSTRSGLGVLSPGFDYSPYPQARTIVFGLNATF